MSQERPNLTVIKVRPTTGLTEGQPSKTVGPEKTGFVAEIRRAWGKFTAKSKPPENS
jgi:hypothetical protein